MDGRFSDRRLDDRAWCFKDEATDYTESVLTAVSGVHEAVVPRLWAYEVRNIVLTGLRRGRITKPDADEFLRSLPGLRVRLIDPLSYDSVFELAGRYGLTVYDAAYLDLALRETAPIATLDKDLIRAAGLADVVLFQS